jgi:hypothetical protein|tara:strand:+ start:974 stop:1279 length:306 start_codon:yes stop_codon:yes gene_type:complete
MKRFFYAKLPGGLGNVIMPADKMVWVATNASTETSIYQLSPAGDEFDVVTITHADDSAASGNTMVKYVQDCFVNVAQAAWYESVLDIGENSPKAISNITFA